MYSTVGCAMDQVVSLWLLTAEVPVQSRSVHVWCLVDRVTLGRVCLRVLLIFPVSIFSPTLHTHLHVRAALTRTNGRIVDTFQKQCCLGNRGSLGRKVLSLFNLLPPNDISVYIYIYYIIYIYENVVPHR
jgi:hypothetical protein